MGIVNFFKKIIRKSKPEKKKSKKVAKPSSKVLSKKPVKKVTKKIKKIAKKKIIKKNKASGGRVARPVKIVQEKFKEKEIGIITHYFNKISVGIIKLKAPLSIGDKIHIKGAHDDFTQNIDSMQLDHNGISAAKKGWEIGIRVIKPVHENDKVYRS